MWERDLVCRVRRGKKEFTVVWFVLGLAVLSNGEAWAPRLCKPCRVWASSFLSAFRLGMVVLIGIWQVFWKFIYLSKLFICMGTLPMCMLVYHVHTWCPEELKKGCQSSGIIVRHSELSYGCCRIAGALNGVWVISLAPESGLTP